MSDPEDTQVTGFRAAVVDRSRRAAFTTLAALDFSVAFARSTLEKGLGRWRRLVLRYMPSEKQHVFALTLVIGVVCGLVAVGFHLAIKLASTMLIDRAIRAIASKSRAVRVKSIG